MEKKSNIEQYDEWVSYIKKHLEIFAHESCAIIYTNLLIYGKLSYNELMNKTDLGRGTIFRALTLLSEANLIEKGIDPKIKDKRMNSYYFAKPFEALFDMDKLFFDYLKEKNLLKLYFTFLRNERDLTNNIVKAVMRIQTDKTIQKIQKKIKNIEKQSKEHKNRFTFTYNEIGSISDPVLFFKEFQNLCMRFEDEIHRKKRDFKEPLSNPVLLSVVFSTLN
ncbi:MAG: hypothetical protein ACFFD1_04375 [Candidatus Thorarchaeota archaeon]